MGGDKIYSSEGIIFYSFEDKRYDFLEAVGKLLRTEPLKSVPRDEFTGLECAIFSYKTLDFVIATSKRGYNEIFARREHKEITELKEGNLIKKLKAAEIEHL